MKRGKKTLRHSFGIVFIAARFHGLLPAAETRMTVAPPFFFFFFGALPEPKHHRETILAMRAFSI